MGGISLVGEGLGILSTGSINILVSLGLALTFRLMNVINLAHGEFLMIGAFVLLTGTGAGIPFGLAIGLALLAGLLLGALTERMLVRRCYRSVELSILATWGLGIVLQQVAELIFGKGYQNVTNPMPGSTSIFGTEFPSYRLALIVVTVGVTAAVLIVLSRTPVGTQLRAVAADDELSETLGVHAGRLKTWAFAASTGLAALAGALVAPISSVGPTMGVDFVFIAFIVVIVAGKRLHMIVVASIAAAVVQNTVTLALDPVIARIAVLLLAIGVLLVARKTSRLAPA